MYHKVEWWWWNLIGMECLLESNGRIFKWYHLSWSLRTSFYVNVSDGWVRGWSSDLDANRFQESSRFQFHTTPGSASDSAASRSSTISPSYLTQIPMISDPSTQWQLSWGKKKWRTQNLGIHLHSFLSPMHKRFLDGSELALAKDHLRSKQIIR